MITAAEYARLRGVSRNAVSKAIKAGRISITKAANGRMLLDPDQADREWAANTDPHRQETGSPKDFAITEQRAQNAAGKDLSSGGRRSLKGRPDRFLVDQKTRFEHLRAETKELELAAMRSSVVSRVAVEAAWSAKVAEAGMLFAAIPDRLSLAIAAETDANKVHRLLTDAIRGAMSKVALGAAAVGTV